MNFFEKIKNCERVYGSMVSNPSVIEAGGVKASGVDFAFIDNEHISLDRLQTSIMVEMYANSGVPPIVRVPKIDDVMVSMAMDMGKSSVLIPYVEEVEDVIKLGSTFKYRPLKGEKLARVACGEYKMSEEEQKYMTEKNRNRCFFINIESQRGIDNLPKMLETGFVDGVIVGPNDLSINIGVPAQYGHPLFEQKMLEILEICKRYHVSCGAHFFWGIEDVIKYANKGMNILLHAGDISLYIDSLNRDLRDMKKALGDKNNATNEEVAI